MATPSFPLRAVSRGVAPYIDDDAVVVSVTKGLEQGTHLRMSQVVAQETGKNVVALTGPSHAEEVCINLPTGLLAASTDQALAEFVQDAFMADTLRVYTSPDPVGAELGAALKNVIALCAGITDGLGFGDNTKAMLMTRGLTETARLGVALGAKKETFAGLAGVGDLIVTCTSMHSRNRRAGILIGQGKDPQTAMKEVGAVIGGEGNGGVIYPELHYGRDALVGAALFLTYLAEKGMTMTELRKTYPAYFASKNKIELTPAIDVDKVLREMKSRYANEKVNDADGVKIDFPENWVHLRKSNTEPIIRVYTEAKTMAEADALARRIIAEIKQICNI